ncbi:unnamed protein product [Symbiodinium pilosum]|uniref:Uncharacterized protein n=1 Tax=Symbiodinium pilosum TaxID=2952 RepID=A0A812NTW0_SYMPI|nr:unnamed protein product [Symbiodinium pilosum]
MSGRTGRVPPYSRELDRATYQSFGSGMSHVVEVGDRDVLQVNFRKTQMQVPQAFLGTTEEGWKPNECIDNALIVMNYADLARHRDPDISDDQAKAFSAKFMFWELTLWLASNALRGVLSFHLLHCALANQDELQKKEKMQLPDKCGGITNLWLLLSGLILVLIKYLTELQDIVVTLGYFIWCRKICHEPEVRGGERNAVNEAYESQVGFLQAMLILLCKFCIESFIAFSSFRFVLVSKDNESVVLNCLAASFLSEIDEMVFRAFSSRTAKDLLDKLEDWSDRDQGREMACCEMRPLLRCFFTYVLTPGLVFLALAHFLDPSFLEVLSCVLFTPITENMVDR